MTNDITIASGDSDDDRLENLWPLLKRRLRHVEDGLKRQSFERQMEAACRFNDRFVFYGKRTFFQAAYLGTTFRLLLKGRSEREQERICEQVGNYSLSAGRRFVKLVDNLSLIVSKVKEQGLILEELSPSRLLEFVPKQEGKGGRPLSAKKQRRAKGEKAPNEVEGGDAPQPDAATSVKAPTQATGGEASVNSPVASVDSGNTTDLSEDQHEPLRAAAEQQATQSNASSVTLDSGDQTTEPQANPERDTSSAEDTIFKLADDALENFRPVIPLQEIREKVAKGEAAVFLVVTVQAVATDADKSILGQGTAETPIQGTWLDAETSQLAGENSSGRQ